MGWLLAGDWAATGSIWSIGVSSDHAKRNDGADRKDDGKQGGGKSLVTENQASVEVKIADTESRVAH